MKFYSYFYKQDFLETIENENTKKHFMSLFNITEKLESQLDKDLYNFNNEEIKILLYSFNSAHKNTLYTYLHQLRQYCDYAIENGDKQSNINLYKIFPVSSLEDYLVTYKLKHLSKDDMNEALKDIYNWVDYALCLSLFEGIGGYEHSEITNMKIDHVKQASTQQVKKYDELYYTITLHGIDKNTGDIKTRDLDISEELLNALLKTYGEQTYYPSNGEADEKHSSRDIIMGDHIFRNIAVGKAESDQVDKQFVYRKLRKINEWTEGLISSLTTIINSGIIYHYSLLAKENQITLQDTEEIFRRYDKFVPENYPNLKFKEFLKKHKNALYELYNVEVID